MQNPNRRRVTRANTPSSSRTITAPPPRLRTPQPPSSASSNNLNSKSKPKPKRKPKPKPKPKKVNSPNPDHDDDVIMAEKGKKHPWAEPSIQTYPPDNLIKTSPHHLCKLHKWLFNTQVDPVDDVYRDMPSSILEGRRANGEGKTHVVHTRAAAGKTTDRRVGKLSAKWVVTETKKVCGLDGSVVGTHSSLVLYFMDKNGGGSVVGKWNMEEFISVDCVARNSAVVVLNCTYGKWDKVERQVEKAESQLLRAYNRPNVSTFALQVALGLQIDELQKVRAHMKELDERRSGAGVVEGPSGRAKSSVAQLGAPAPTSVGDSDSEEEDPTRDLTLPTATLRDPSETP